MKEARKIFLLFPALAQLDSENNYMPPPGDGNSSGVPRALQTPGDMSAAGTKTSHKVC